MRFGVGVGVGFWSVPGVGGGNGCVYVGGGLRVKSCVGGVGNRFAFGSGNHFSANIFEDRASSETCMVVSMAGCTLVILDGVGSVVQGACFGIVLACTEHADVDVITAYAVMTEALAFMALCGVDAADVVFYFGRVDL